MQKQRPAETANAREQPKRRTPFVPSTLMISELRRETHFAEDLGEFNLHNVLRAAMLLVRCFGSA